jgi:uncharacterized protein
VNRRVVFDSAIVARTLLFADGRLAWLRQHWQERGCVPLISHTTALELTRVLGAAKFGLSPEDRRELLAEYLPYCGAVEVTEKCGSECGDAKRQSFLDLAQSGKAEFLITADQDLLMLAGQTRFLIAPPEAYLRVVREG